MLDWLCDNWQRADDGIWEVRGGRQHFVFSRMMCWVAFDRALRMANKRGLPAPADPLGRTRDRIYEEIMAKGYDPELADLRAALRRRLRWMRPTC